MGKSSWECSIGMVKSWILVARVEGWSSRRIESLVLLMLGSNGTNVLMSDLFINGICIVG